MKRTLIALTALLCLGVPGAAVADETTDALMDRIDRLTVQLHDTTKELEHKSDLLACERQYRRQLQRALRTGSPVALRSPC